VYYNPKNPEESALEPGVDRRMLVLMFGGGSGFLFFAWIAIMSVRLGFIKT
jgi:hypothetical protein